VIGAGSDFGTIGGGESNVIQYANWSTIGGGFNNTVRINAPGSTIAGGQANTILSDADYATIPGGRNAGARLYGQFAYASGRFADNGDAQTSIYVLRRTTTSTATNELFLDGASQRLVLPPFSVWAFDILVVGKRGSGSTEYAGYQIRGAIIRIGASANSVAFADPPTKTVLAEALSAWDANVEADGATGALVIKVSGAGGTTRWVASVRTVEVTD
jgi:hypothetical protein